MVDFWGAGFDVAERMGLLPAILEKGYAVRELREVDRDGKRVSGFPVDAISRLTGGRATSIPRDDLAAVLYGALEGRVETIFGDGISLLEDDGDQVRVHFDRAPTKMFDLVIGADGLHSRVRELAFGHHANVERHLGLKVAAFATHGYRPRDELVYVTHTQVGGQMGRFTMRGDRTMFLLIFTDPDPVIPEDAASQKRLLRDRFGDFGWETPRILDVLDRCDALYFDRVSQVRLDRWSKGRTALVGDAAFCISLLGGQGSALAMVAAYVLAGELKTAAGDFATAFERYEAKLRPLIETKQRGAIKLASFFAPRSSAGLFLRNGVMRLMTLPLVPKLAAGRELVDRIALPPY